jgi:biotin-dependent carboxylase-like uncharacterized protein
MIRILAAGVRATVQDSGRTGHIREGVPTAGPMDPFAFAAANALVGNEAGAAAVEIVGPPFTFSTDDRRIVAVTGRDVALRGRDEVAAWTAAFARAGQTYTVTGGGRARFAYLAVSGGITSRPVLGSRATYLPARLGAVLRAGEALPVGNVRLDPERAGRSLQAPEYGAVVRALPGPHAERFDLDAVAAFFTSEFRVDGASDRMGTRLAGPRIVARRGDTLTCGVVAGAVQVPTGGAPIVLLADHQTTGGYPVIAVVIAADRGRVAQRLPGEDLRFESVDRERALAALRAARDELAATA